MELLTGIFKIKIVPVINIKRKIFIHIISIKKKNKFNTFPQVFVDNKLIGGNDDFVRIVDMCDKLNGMLNNINDDVIQIILKLCCEISDGNNCKINKLLKKQQPKKKSKKNKK